MSVYTTELRYICEAYAGLDKSEDYPAVENIIQNSLGKIFDFDFPIFDESYRNVLETKIVRHYYTREIGFETVGLFKLKLNTKLNEIMPYYNKLYNSELLEFNPLYDVDVTTLRKTTGSGSTDKENSNKKTRGITENIDTQTNSTTDTNTESTVENQQSEARNISQNHKQMYSDTPQGAITDLESGRYMTNATVNVNNDNETVNTNGESKGQETGSNNFEGTERRDRNYDEDENVTGNESSNFNNLEDYIEHVTGSTPGKSISQRLIDFRNTFLNIDMMVIDELDELFMGLWY